MSRTLAFSTLLILPLIVGIVSGADPIAQVDAKLTTDGQIWQGQQVTVTVIIKTPDTFASAPAFDLPKVPGTILVPPSGRPTLGTETIGDDSYTTQSHELSVFPQRAGTTTIPPFVIRFESTVGFGKPVQERTVTTPAVSFAVKQPPGTNQNAIVLTTTKLTVAESWQPELTRTAVTVGSAFTRTIRIQAANLSAIVLPSFKTNLPPGLRQYHRDRTLNDKDNRGDSTGERTETTTIVCEQAGNYELPALSVTWWNPQEQQLHHETLPAHSINVEDQSKDLQPEPSATTATTTYRSPMHWLSLISSILIVATIGYFASHAFKNHWQTQRAMYTGSEKYYFANVVKACQSNDPKAAYSAILAWRDKIESQSDPIGSSLRPRFADDSQLLAEFNRLESDLYGLSKQAAATRWSSRLLLARLTQFRIHRKAGHNVSMTSTVLPVLNASR